MSKTKWYAKPIYLLVALALVLSLGIVAVPMAGTAEASPATLHVSKWTEYAGKPVFGQGIDSGAKAYYPTVVKLSDNDYRIWYGSDSGVGYATSPDGLTWTEVSNPVTGLTNANHPLVEYIDGGFRIWYWDTGASIYTIDALRYAESTDGASWSSDQPLTQDGTCQLITGTGTGWNSGSYGPGDVIYNPNGSDTFDDSNIWNNKYVFYYMATNGSNEYIGLAYSVDGKDWKRYGDAPVLSPCTEADDPGVGWDYRSVGYPTVMKDTDGMWHMWFCGGPNTNHGIGYAWSSDGISWTKVFDPIFHKDDGVTWRAKRTYTPMVIQDGAKYKMWFSGKDASGNYAIGYATADGPYPTIQSAIDAASDGDTIIVHNGTYNENVVIDRTLTLIAGSSPVIINAGGTSTTPNVIGIAIAANDVTVDGFTVINGRGSNSGGIYVGGTFVGETRGLRGVIIKNCTVHDSNFGIYPWGTGSGNANVVDHNTVYDIYDDMSGGGGVGIVLWDEGAGAVGNSDNEVTNNTVYNCDRQGIFLGTMVDVPNDNNEISGNIVHDNGLNTGVDGHGIQLYYAADNTISNNEIYKHTAATSWFQAGVMLNYSNDNAISGNNIYDNKIGVALYTNTGVNTIHFNCITGNTDKGVGNWDYAILVDAENNWWGDASGPYDPWGNPYGKGDEVSYAVDCDPWLTGLAYTGDSLFSSTTPVVVEATLSNSTPGGASGADVSFYVDDDFVGSATTNASGVATLDIGSQPVGVYTVKALAAGCLEAEALLAVYDPTAGFVTGGGWINSPAGAYTPEPSLTGKATFGFVSKYKKGATTPTGQTEFQFKAADLNFHSTSYDWLVVTGSDYARFKGTGTINGAGPYKFMLWAGDGDPDTFRIKIWYEVGDAENVVYDNGMDQTIGGGSIVVHTSKK